MQAFRAIVAAAGLLFAPAVCGAGEAIATIDTYGLGKVPRERVLAAANLRAGEAVPAAGEIARIVRRLEAIEGVERADVSVIPVHGQGDAPDDGPRPTVYLGIREIGQPAVSFRPAPSSEIVLPKEVVEACGEFRLAVHAAFRRGPVKLHSGDRSVRAVEQRLASLAGRHHERLGDVLRAAENAERRKMAAQVLGYAADKKKAAVELDAAVRDPDPHVRNDAMRALGVFLADAKQRAELTKAVTVESYIELLESLVWTDRNKAMFVLLGLTADGNQRILALLRARSLAALAEMAHWKFEGHAMMAFVLLGRIIGMSDAETAEAWRAGNRDAVIARAMEQ